MSKLIQLFCILLFAYTVSADYSAADALEYAYASALSHCDPSAIHSWTCGAACVNLTGYQGYYSEVYNATKDQSLAFAMILNPTTKRFVTTYRGTAGSMELLMEILQGNAVPYNLSNIPNAVVDNYFYSHYANGLRSAVIANLTAAYKEYPDYDFIFTGHSLGAAFATLNALDVVNLGLIPRDQVILYNYGSPRVGNIAFVKALEAALPVIYRVVHWRDIVPHLPPCNKSGGKCVPSMEEAGDGETGLLWPAWHAATQVFYNQASTNYTICVGDEDPNCMDQFDLTQTDPLDHLVYVNVNIGCDANATVFKVPPTRDTVFEMIERGVIKGYEMFTVPEDIIM